MRYLLDTHILLWAVAQSYLLSPAMSDVLADGQNSIYFSVINLWEMAIKSSLPRRDLKIEATVARREALAYGFRELQVTAEHAFAVRFLPAIHKDPFDRLLIAQARAEGLQLLTADAQIQRYFAP